MIHNSCILIYFNLKTELRTQGLTTGLLLLGMLQGAIMPTGSVLISRRSASPLHQ